MQACQGSTTEQPAVGALFQVLQCTCQSVNVKKKPLWAVETSLVVLAPGVGQTSVLEEREQAARLERQA